MSEHESFLDFNLDEVPELQIAKGNMEYQLRIEHAEIKESKGDKTAGQNMLALRCKIEDEPNTQSVFEYIMLPSNEIDQEANDQRKRALKRLVEAVGLDPARGFNIDELVGQTFWAILDEEEGGGFEPRNTIRKYMKSQAS